MKDIILFGIQGSGKGTQARLLSEKYGYRVFEMGNDLRTLSREDSALGREVKQTIDAGRLVSDELVIQRGKGFLGKVLPQDSVVFDGIPRKIKQMNMLEAIFAEIGRKPIGIHIRIDDELAVKRLSNRWMSRSKGKIYPSRETAVADVGEADVYQRDDDTPDAIRTRLAAYHLETQPVIDWYRQEGRLLEVDGEREAESVLEELAQLIGG